MSTTMSFSQKVVLVTGAAGGLGKAVAQAFLKAGARVSICDVNADRLSATKAEFTYAFGKDQILPIVADITSRDEIRRVHEITIKTFGRLDVLVNNAGIVDKSVLYGFPIFPRNPWLSYQADGFIFALKRYDPVGTLPESVWDKVLAVNLTAPVIFSKLAVSQFLEQQPPGGVIVNISSAAGVKGHCAGVAYTSTKHALIGLTKNTAAFYNKKNIRAVVFLPGAMDTPIKETLVGLNEEAWQLALKTTAMEPNVADIHDVAQIVLFYASDSARPSNGALVTVDGGWLAF